MEFKPKIILKTLIIFFFIIFIIIYIKNNNKIIEKKKSFYLYKIEYSLKEKDYETSKFYSKKILKYKKKDIYYEIACFNLYNISKNEKKYKKVKKYKKLIDNNKIINLVK